MNNQIENHILYPECYDNNLINQIEVHILYEECYAPKENNRNEVE